MSVHVLQDSNRKHLTREGAKDCSSLIVTVQCITLSFQDGSAALTPQHGLSPLRATYSARPLFEDLLRDLRDAYKDSTFQKQAGMREISFHVNGIFSHEVLKLARDVRGEKANKRVKRGSLLCTE